MPERALWGALMRTKFRGVRRIHKLGNHAFAQDGPRVAKLANMAAEDSTMVISAVISTPVRDRGGDVMEPLGCLLEQYERNPVVLLGHGLGRFPVATSRIGGKLCVFPEKNRVWAKAQFHDRTQDSVDAYALWRDGLLNGTSIGFLPEEAEQMPLTDEMIPQGLHVTRWHLLEWSIVDVPMNPETVRLSWQGDRIASILGRGWIEGKRPISDMMRKALLPLAAKPKRSVAVSHNPPKWTKDVQECVSRKIPKLLSEGYEQDQAAAIAYSMCGEKSGNISDEKPPVHIQSIHFKKEKFASPQAAEDWMRDKKEYHANDPQHSSSHWIYHQFPEKEMDENTRTERELDDGVHVVEGERKGAIEDAAGEHHQGKAAKLPSEKPEQTEEEIDDTIQDDFENDMRPSVAWKSTAIELYSNARDHMDSADSTQDHPHVRHIGRMHGAILSQMTKDVEKIDPDKHDFDEGAGHYLMQEGSSGDGEKSACDIWQAGLNAEGMVDGLHKALALVARLYKKCSLTPSEKEAAQREYKSLKMLIAGTKPSEEAQISSSVLAELFKPLVDKAEDMDKRLQQITGAA
jgi:hypothetical protein